MINGEKLACKTNSELISKLNSSQTTGPVALSFLRRVNGNAFGSSLGTAKDQIPYHNGIFAQNSIKLAMRKYEKLTLKSDNELDPSSQKDCVEKGEIKFLILLFLQFSLYFCFFFYN
jgi:hypothetical protein